ncbi:MAG TPA: alpha/beta fold hydrolase [Candidatus Kapabacteria bacterium]|nr:alpha/beta fold hydrolase [Candidatus Kapabacteria bacterium]
MKNIIAILLLAVVSSACRAQPVDSTLFSESPITLHTSTGNIYGTLCEPTKAKHFPVALIIAGSGPTDRDGNSMMLYSDCYKILAHRLAANNIATIRYDKRGIGESRAAMTKESDLRFDNYIDDARAWIDSLKHSGQFTEVIVIGHSEGSLIGMIAARDADKYVSIAGVGNKADVVLKHQLANLPEQNLPEPLRGTAFAILDSVAAGHLVNDVPPSLGSLFRPSVQPYLISWMKYSPEDEIRKLYIPVLIIQGTNDIQVDTNEAKLLVAADPRAKLVLIKNMNHIFRIVAGDRAENLRTYGNPDLPISDELVSAITEFIEAR